MKADLREVDVRIVGEAMVSDHAVEVLRELCDGYGSRFAGSRQARGAADFLAEKMREVGLAKVHFETFRFLAWERRRRPSLRVVAPRKVSLEAITLPYSPATRDEGIEAELVNVGCGVPEDFARVGRRLKGKIAMVTSESPAYYHRWVHRAEKYARAVKAGAVAFIFMNHYEGLLEPTGALRFNRRAEIPGLGVSREVGLRLLRLASEGTVRLRIVTHDRTFRATGRNVVGEISGTDRPDEMVVVGGHYDGHDISQAAGDNASGIAAILEAARLLAPHARLLRRTVRFVCFDAEEIGLLGGHAYVRRHAAEMPRVRLMVNVDCVGRGRGKGFNFQGWDEAKERLGAMAAEMHEDIPFHSKPNPYSDHFPFMVAGVPVCVLASGRSEPGRGYGHTAADTLDKVARADLREAAALLARSIIRFVNDRRWALRHKKPAEVKALLNRYELIDVMKAEGTLPAELKR